MICQWHGPHCLYCRTDPAWRSRTTLPEVCPDGVTEMTLPIASAVPVVRVKGCGTCGPVPVLPVKR